MSWETSNFDDLAVISDKNKKKIPKAESTSARKVKNKHLVFLYKDVHIDNQWIPRI
jgi:hypothetical protein